MISEITQNDLYLHALWLADNSEGAKLVTAPGTIKVSTNLSGANLSHADLSHADLSGANLAYADLYGANLSGVKNIPDIVIAQTSILPDEGDVVGWKILQNKVIAKLLIPADAKRSNATGRKCRAERAIVLDLLKDGEHIESGVSLFDSTFIYRVGETVMPREPFCEDRWQECASGIHFFITRAEAEAWDE